MRLRSSTPISLRDALEDSYDATSRWRDESKRLDANVDLEDDATLTTDSDERGLNAAASPPVGRPPADGEYPALDVSRHRARIGRANWRFMDGVIAGALLAAAVIRLTEAVAGAG